VDPHRALDAGVEFGYCDGHGKRLLGYEYGDIQTEIQLRDTIFHTVESRVQFPMTSLDSSTYLILPASLGPGFYSASNRNEYQVSSWGKARPACRAVNLTAI
jgi:hypothetical protein